MYIILGEICSCSYYMNVYLSGGTPTMLKFVSLKPMVLQTSFINTSSTVAVRHIVVQSSTLRRYPISLYASRKSLKMLHFEKCIFLGLMNYKI